ncbi:hypothetical protein [Nocardioides sp. NPDC004968]|uniref:hypothetical protein n=1 Tax=Nocardioides sp. NPDC004968 TaxID=3155894 RepID=UPI0033B852D0
MTEEHREMMDRLMSPAKGIEAILGEGFTKAAVKVLREVVADAPAGLDDAGWRSYLSERAAEIEAAGSYSINTPEEEEAAETQRKIWEESE